MLSERERRTFQEIEQQIVGDPRFVVQMQRLLSGRADWRTRLIHDATLVLAALSAVLCAVLSLPGPALVTAVLAAGAWYIRPVRPSWPWARRPPHQSP